MTVKCWEKETVLTNPLRSYEVYLTGDRMVRVYGNEIRAQENLLIYILRSNADPLCVAAFKDWEYFIIKNPLLKTEKKEGGKCK